MPSRYSRTLTGGTVAALALLATAAALTASEPRDRGATTGTQAQAEKENKLGPFKTAPLYKHTEKLRGPLKARIERADTKAIQPGEVFVLKGSITTRQELERQAEFTWVLPEGVELVSGQLSGSAWVTPDQPLALELTVKKKGDSNAQIHLVTSSARGGASFADTAQFNTHAQENSAGLKAQMSVQKAASSNAQVQDKSPQAIKIFH